MADPMIDDQWAVLGMPNLAHVATEDGGILIDAGAIEQFEALGYEVLDPQVTPPIEDPFEVKGKDAPATEGDVADDVQALIDLPQQQPESPPEAG
jgi:hypothetical protein